jgi:uncharacterized membrane protein
MENQNQPVPPVNQPVEIDHDKLWSVIAYIIFFLPLLVAKKRSSFLNYHINQGIILFIVAIVGNIGLDLLPFWLAIFAWFHGIWNAAVIVLMVIGIKNVLEKKMQPLPVIGKLFTFLK